MVAALNGLSDLPSYTANGSKVGLVSFVLLKDRVSICQSMLKSVSPTVTVHLTFCHSDLKTPTTHYIHNLFIQL